MTTILFLLTFLTLPVLLVRLIIKAIKRKPLKSTLKIMGLIAGVYLLLWTGFYFASGYTTIPLGTDVCFDDWCATVTKIDNEPVVKAKLPALPADSTWVILHIKMSNHARGIAQKPSEPRVHLIDAQGGYWPYSAIGQQALEKTEGPQPGIDNKLELHQSMETQLVFAIPATAKEVKVLIEEGPASTKLLLPDDREVFSVPQ
ncbi:hypothetical protein [Mucilaginibacter sp.]|uniref:hypothetical protein n=1 Tax=Mucilaginibacter sp. TaxID=1882438 RepID=UPI00284D5D78|nr:hypothetical protein [Mucilaginibacter sp.]MDR3697840.1 hypothetical protein [Mucilaginibacter sp.]